MGQWLRYKQWWMISFSTQVNIVVGRKRLPLSSSIELSFSVSGRSYASRPCPGSWPIQFTFPADPARRILQFCTSCTALQSTSAVLLTPQVTVRSHPLPFRSRTITLLTSAVGIVVVRTDQRNCFVVDINWHFVDWYANSSLELIHCWQQLLHCCFLNSSPEHYIKL